MYLYWRSRSNKVTVNAVSLLKGMSAVVVLSRLNFILKALNVFVYL